MEDESGCAGENPVHGEKDEHAYLSVDEQFELAEDENHYLQPTSNFDSQAEFEDDRNYSEINDGNKTRYINSMYNLVMYTRRT